MTFIIAITNQKGGVGKTTTAVNLAACLAASRRKTLLIDMDPQGNASSGLGVRAANGAKSIYQVLLEGMDPADALLETELEFLKVLPSHMDLVGAEMELIDLEDRTGRLKKVIEPILADYQYVLVDCPPSLGLLTVNVLAFVQSVLIPVQCEYYALEGLTSLVHTVQRIRNTLNPGLFIQGLALTMFDGRTNLAQQVRDEVYRVFQDKVFKTLISRSVKFSEASSFGKPMILYDLRSKGAQNYVDLCQEVVHVCEKTGPGSRT